MHQQCRMVAEHLLLYLMLLVGSVLRTTCALLVALLLYFPLNCLLEQPNTIMASQMDRGSSVLEGFHLWVRGGLLGQTFPVPAMKPGVTYSYLL